MHTTACAVVLMILDMKSGVSVELVLGTQAARAEHENSKQDLHVK